MTNTYTAYRQSMIAMYLMYFNGYLTFARFAEDIGVTEEHARVIYTIGKKYHEEQVAIERLDKILGRRNK